MEGPHENEFWAFSNSEMNITNRLEKVDEKNAVICLVFMLPSWVMVLKLHKSAFLQFCADLSEKSKAIKAIYMYASESSRYTLSEIDVVYYAMTYCFNHMSVWSNNFWGISAGSASFFIF